MKNVLKKGKSQVLYSIVSLRGTLSGRHFCPYDMNIRVHVICVKVSKLVIIYFTGMHLKGKILDD